MMTAQIANGGFAVKPKIIVDSNPISYEDAKQSMESGFLFDSESEELLDKRLFKDKKNIKIVQEAMFSSTNERFGTSYKSRIDACTLALAACSSGAIEFFSTLIGLPSLFLINMFAKSNPFPIVVA